MDSTNLVIPTAKHFRETCSPQVFPFSMSIMKYIWSNPSSTKVYKKLIKCCKLFFIKNPILAIHSLSYNSSEGWTYCNGKNCNIFWCKFEHKIDLSNKKNKIWITKEFLLSSALNKTNVASYIITRIYRFEVNTLSLNNQHLSYNELKILSKGVKDSKLYNCILKFDNDETVPLENIVGLFSGATKFYMSFSSAPDNTICKSYDDFIKACNTVNKIELNYVPNLFDVYDFYQHLKNSKNRVLFYLHFIEPNHRINEIINEICQTEYFNFVPPVIDYPSILNHDFNKMKGIQAEIATKFR